MTSWMRWVVCAAALLALAACGDKCNAGNCNGCCDASGTCQDPSPAHCGINGASCSACLAIQVCSLGVCEFGGGNNGGGNNGGSTSGTHGAATSSGSTTGGSTTGGSTGSASGSTGGATGTTGSCAANGASCSSPGACCSQNCASGTCGPAVSCAGDDCAAGQAYGGCCGAAPYCGGQNSAGQQPTCQAACNPTGKSCVHASDCCAGLSCTAGLCAAPSCAGNACTSDATVDGCCGDAPYCVGANGGALSCSNSCGQSGARCTADFDCCGGFTCNDGTCSTPTCSGTFCTSNYPGGGCCAAASQCVNNACSASCGQLHDYCASDYDCCDGVCVTDGTDAYTHCTAICASQGCSAGFAQGGCCPSAQYCVNGACSPSCGTDGSSCRASSDCCFPDACTSGVCTNSQCSGQTCTAGHSAGGCCANAPYCTSYYSQPQRCAAACGQASMRCSSNGDCCSFNCAIDSVDGMLHCR